LDERQKGTEMNYIGSEAYKSVMGATLPMLINRRLYTVFAIEYWEELKDTEQVRFFRDELKLIDKRMSQLRRD
jgi:hypothetical protein